MAQAPQHPSIPQAVRLSQPQSKQLPRFEEDDVSFEFKLQQGSSIYRALAEHQRTTADWDLHKFLAWIQIWSERLIQEFKLGVSDLSFCVDGLSCLRYGHFRHGRNGFGLAGEIALNRRYLQSREPWEHLGTLLHELLHAWQEKHGKPGKRNYHNKVFRQKARSLGLIIDSRGCTQFESGSPFFAVLEKYGVAQPKLPPVQYVLRGQSKLKKWSCQCQPPINVRVAIEHFSARCMLCGELFRRADSSSN